MIAVRLHGVIKTYDWGKKDFIPSLLGIPQDGNCMAEYWMGAHPSGDASLDDGSKLSSYLEEHADACLGKAHIARYGKTLPFLFKVLAIEKPLSIQCHPTVAQAKAGWKKEASLRQSDPNRGDWNYQDENQKAEVLYALTPVTAMCGFRHFLEIDRCLSHLMPVSYEKYFSGIGKGDKALERLFTTLYTMPKEELSVCIDEYVQKLRLSELPFASADGRFLEPKGIVLSCYESFPTDPGLFCPFLLHVVHLEPGEALYLQPDTLHAYVLGDGMELMSSSDNVLRGGLTHKRVDVPELLSILSIHGQGVGKCVCEKDEAGRLRIVTPAPEFSLLSLHTGSYEVKEHPAAEVVLVTEGKAVLDGTDGTEVLHKGECYLIPQSVGSYVMTVEGQVFSATTGR